MVSQINAQGPISAQWMKTCPIVLNQFKILPLHHVSKIQYDWGKDLKDKKNPGLISAHVC